METEVEEISAQISALRLLCPSLTKQMEERQTPTRRSAPWRGPGSPQKGVCVRAALRSQAPRRKAARRVHPLTPSGARAAARGAQRSRQPGVNSRDSAAIFLGSLLAPMGNEPLTLASLTHSSNELR